MKNKSPISESFSFQTEKENQLHSRLKVYLKGKFRRNFNKSSSEQELDTYKNQKTTKRFNDSLMKSIQCIKDREKLDLNSFKMSFNKESNRTNSTLNKLSLKNNKQLIYLNRIDLSNNSSILETSGMKNKLG